MSEKTPPTITIPFESKFPIPTLREVDAYLEREGWTRSGAPRHDVQHWAHPDHKGRTLQCPADESAIFWGNAVSYAVRQVIEVTSEEPFDVIAEMLFPGKQSDMLFHHFVEFKGEVEELTKKRAKRQCEQSDASKRLPNTRDMFSDALGAGQPAQPPLGER